MLDFIALFGSKSDIFFQGLILLNLSKNKAKMEQKTALFDHFLSTFLATF